MISRPSESRIPAKSKLIRFLASLLMLSCCSAASLAQTTTTARTYTTSGGFYVGAGVSSISVSMWGGGGGGSCGGIKEYTNATDYNIRGGGGGGGSNWAGGTIAVTANAFYLFTVGTGGAAGGMDSDGNPLSGGNGTQSYFMGMASYGGFGGTVSGIYGLGGARAINSVPDAGAPYAASGTDGTFTGGGNGGLSNAGPYGPSSTVNPNGWSGLGYPQVLGLGAGGPGTRPGDGGGGGGFTNLPPPFTAYLSQRKPGGPGANGIITFYTTYPTYRITEPIVATKLCGSGTPIVSVRSQALFNGTYTVTYNTTNPVTTGNTATMIINNSYGTFSTIPLSATSTITITNLASGNTCTDAITENNTATVIVQNTTPNDWNTQNDFGGTARSGAVGFSLGNKAYVGTGTNGTAATSDFWEFDPLTNAWTQKASFAGGVRKDAVGFAIGTKAYVGTGSDGTNNKNDFWEFDPFGNKWIAKAAFPGQVRHSATGMSIGSKGYIGTGINGSTYLNDFYEYNPATNAWTAKATFANGLAFSTRGKCVAFTVGQYGYMGMGANSGSTYASDFFRYDPATNTWQFETTYPGTSRAGAVGFVIGSKAYVGTGYNGSAGTNEFYEYTPSTTSWAAKAGFQGAARSYGVGFSIGNKGYIGLGVSGTTSYKDFFEYTTTTTHITTSAIPTSSVCTGTTVSVPFIIGCVAFNNGNTFTAQLSDADGNFGNPVAIGTTTTASDGALSNMGTITATIPTNTAAGAKYRIRVVSSNPVTIGTDNGVNFAVKPSVAATVTAGINKTVMCRADSVSLTASVSNTATSDTTVLLSENFNSGAPDWVISLANSYDVAGSLTEIFANGQGGQYSNDNTAFYGTQSAGRFSSDLTNTTLQSPSISTLGVNTASLTFYHHYQYGNYNNSDSIRILASIDNGATWTRIYLNNSTSVGDPQDSLGFVKQTISLNAFVNQPFLVLRFNYGARGGMGRWFIDNIKITGVGNSNNYSWTSSPAGFTSTRQNPTGVVPTAVPGTTVYTVAFSNSFGCGTVSNSVSVLVKDTTGSTTTLSVCPSQLPYQWNGLSFATAGTQTARLTNAAGCDSFARLILVVRPNTSSTTNISICPSELPYTWNGLVFTGAGTQTAHFTNSVGCDSAATANLTIRLNSTLTVSTTICESSLPYTWNGLTFNSAGSQTAHLTNSVGCDSAVTLNLTIIASVASAGANMVSICPGAVINLTANAGAGTSVTLINEKFNSTHNNWTTQNLGSGGIVANAAWTLRPNGYEPLLGLSFTSNDNSSFYLSSSYAQGYQVTTHTILQSPVFSTVGLTAASLSFYHTFNHQTFSANDSIRVQVSNDGTTWTNLYINKTTSVGFISQFEQLTLSLNGYLNQPTLRLRFVYNGTPINSSFSNLWWAIDNVLVTGTVAPSTFSWTSVPAGFTSSAQNPAGLIPSQTTTYNVAVSNGFCTASRSVTVTVNTTNPSSTTNIAVCPSALPYTWNGLVFNAAGTQTKHITTAGGCDSSAILNLSLKATSSSTTNITICPSALPYTWNGLVFAGAGSQTKYLTNSIGCDSAATLNLTVQTSSSSSLTTITICETGLPYTWNGLQFTGSGRQTKMLTNSFGCDSAATLNLVVVAKPANLVVASSAASICSGGTINLSASTTVTTSLINENFNGSAAGWTKENTSTGTNYSPNGNNWTLRGDRTLTHWGHTFRSIDRSQFYMVDATLEPYIIRSMLTAPSFSTVGYSSATLSFEHGYVAGMAGNGTDSIQVQVSVDNGVSWTNLLMSKTSIGLPAAFVQQSFSLDAFLHAPSVLLRFNYGGTSPGAWAIDNVTVTGTPTPVSYSWASVPAGFTSALQNPTGLTPAQSTTYQVIATNSNGCKDSGTVAVTVKPLSTSTTNLVICNSLLPYSWNGLTFAGSGSQTAHLTNSVGCDSAATLVLTVRSVSTSSTTLAICQSDLPYSWNGLTFAAAGTQTAHLTNSVGCDSAATLVLSVNANPTAPTAGASAASICQGSPVNLTSSSGAGLPTVVLNENFNAATNAWTKTNASTGGTPSAAAWTLWPYEVGGSIQSNDQSQYYFSFSDAQGGGTTRTTLTSPAFSTMNMSAASLTFYHFYLHLDGSDSIRVQISTDNTNWTNIYLNKTISVGDYTAFALQTISLNSYLNQPSVRIRFNYNANWAYYWAIDNVKVSGTVSNSYSWTSTPAGFTSSQQNPTGIVPTQTTTYHVAASNSSGCSTSASVLVTVTPAPSATITYGFTPFCTSGGTATVLQTGTAGGVYSAPAGLAIDASTGSVSLSSSTPGTYTVTYTIAASGSCPVYTATTSITVNSNYSITASAGANGTISSAGLSTVCAETDKTYTITPGACAAVADVLVDGVSVGAVTSYTFNGVSGDHSISATFVSQAPTPTIVAGGPTTFCSGGSVLIGSSSAAGNQWYRDGSLIAGATAATYTATASGIYTVIVTDGCGTSPVSAGITVTAQAFSTWTGAVDRDWSKAGNWCGSLPGATTDVVIPVTANQPIVYTTGMVRDLTIQTGTSLTVLGTMNLYGDLVNTGGSLNMSSGTLDLEGSTSQDIPAFTVQTMNVNGGGGFSLAGASVVTGTLSFGASGGHVILGASDLTVGNISGGDVNAFVVTNGTGALVRKALTGTQLMPVGVSTGSFTPLNITSVEGLDWSVRLQADFTGYSAINQALALQRIWHITPSVTPTATPASLVFTYPDALWTTPAAVSVFHFHSGRWTLANNNASGLTAVLNGTLRSVSLAAQQEFSPFALGGTSTPLPVTLLSFSGKNEGSVNKLHWATATEQNNRGFEVQRSYNGTTFATIGFVRSAAGAAGNSNALLDYSFNDNSFSGKRQYYRLSQVDLDGRTRFSQVVLLQSPDLAPLTIFPNPADNKVIVSFETAVADKVTVVVTDMRGSRVRVATHAAVRGANAVAFDLTGLASGSYSLQVFSSTGSNLGVAKLIKR